MSPFFSFLCHSSSLLLEISIHVEIRIGLEAKIREEEGRRREEEEGETEKKEEEEEERKGTRRNETEDGRMKRKYYKRVFELSSIVL